MKPMEQLELEKSQEQLQQQIKCCHSYEMQVVFYKKLIQVMEQLNSIYKQQVENLKRQIK